MKAARVVSTGEPVRIEEIPEPELRPGSALVGMEAATILSYMKLVLSGELGYRLPPLPFTPGTGGVGRIEAVAADVLGIKLGQRVFIDPRFVARENVVEPETVLIGLATFQPSADPLLEIWRDGSFAEKTLRPVDCLTPLDNLDHIDAARLACMAKLMVAYGGLLRGNLKPGETLLVNGATGSLGSAAVPLGLAMGAARVVALGRDVDTLERLAAKMGSKRLHTVQLTGDLDQNIRAIAEGGGGNAHIALDLVGLAESGAATLACLRSLRRHGRLVLTGSMKVPLELPYTEVMLRDLQIVGSFMYPRDAPAQVAAMIAAGLVDLDWIDLDVHPLDAIDVALDRAADVRGLSACVLSMA